MLDYVMHRLREPELADRISPALLERVLRAAREDYYARGSTLSDAEYDALEDILRRRNPASKLFREIGHEPGAKVVLPFVCEGLSKIKNADINGKYRRVWVADKIDGVSVLIYHCGNMVNIYTRGDGRRGQDISHLAPYLGLHYAAKPGTLRFQFRSRGLAPRIMAYRAEVVMDDDVFWRHYQSVAANPRNLVAGALNSRSNDLGSWDRLRRCRVIGHELLFPRHKGTIADALEWMALNGVETVPGRWMKHPDSVRLDRLLARRRKHAAYAMDGLVLWDDASNKIAYKSDASSETREARVRAVHWKTSKEGYLKPRVEIEPVKLSGVKIKYITGNNYRFIRDGGIGAGAKVVIIRSGDVIPKIIDVLEKTDPALPEIPFSVTESGADAIARLQNRDQIVGRIIHFVRTVGMEGVKDKTVAKLWRILCPHSPDADGMLLAFATLNGRQEIESVLGRAQARILLDQLADIQQNGLELPVYMAASGMFGHGIGISRLDSVTSLYPDICVQESVDLTAVPGISDKTARRIRKGLPKFIRFMRQSGIPIKAATPRSGISVAFTGFRDSVLEKLITAQGAVISNAVSARTTFVIAAAQDSVKAKRAMELGIPILTKKQAYCQFSVK